MAFKKLEFYPNSSQTLAAQSYALGHSARSQILLDLMRVEMNTNELLKSQMIARQTLRSHINILLKNGYISVFKHIPKPEYRIMPENIPVWVFVQLLKHPNSERELVLEYLPKELGKAFREYYMRSLKGEGVKS